MRSFHGFCSHVFARLLLDVDYRELWTYVLTMAFVLTDLIRLFFCNFPQSHKNKGTTSKVNFWLLINPRVSPTYLVHVIELELCINVNANNLFAINKFSSDLGTNRSTSTFGDYVVNNDAIDCLYKTSVANFFIRSNRSAIKAIYLVSCLLFHSYLLI